MKESRWDRMGVVFLPDVAEASMMPVLTQPSAIGYKPWRFRDIYGLNEAGNLYEVVTGGKMKWRLRTEFHYILIEAETD